MVNVLSPQTQRLAIKTLQRTCRALRAKHRVRPEADWKRSRLTEKWVRRELSNFEYLLQLNWHAGRTYNDLTQYPIFPWVLKDFESETIDLDDEAVYRDLRRPIGTLGDVSRTEEVVERYASMVEMEMEPFHYGSHYSSAGVVLYYLIRLEPFTSFGILLQGGKFDHADRMFDRWWPV